MLILKSNFTFLEKKWPLLYTNANLAEKYLFSDSNSCLYKLGKFAESIVNLMFELDGIDEGFNDNSQSNKIKILKKEGLLPREIDNILYSLRISRNEAVHTDYESIEQSKVLLELAHKLAIWFMQTYGEWDFNPDKFILPNDTSKETSFETIIKTQEDKIKELTEKLNTQYHQDNKITIEERAKRSSKSAGKIKLNEKETRYIIDEQLKKVGWEADSIRLRYSNGTKPQKGRNIAIAEWPTDSKILKYGTCDYALFVGTKLYAVIEAKSFHNDIISVIDNQCKDYAENIKSEHTEYVIGKWGNYKVPFIFATNGRKYLGQLKTKSGIWFMDTRRTINIPKALRGWLSPEGITELYEKDIEAANAALDSTKYDLLTDKDGLNLRPYQLKAVKKVENAVINNQTSILISMATGTGKTRTVLGMIYRFLSTKRFNRILFLVDRNALGEQAQDVFKEVKIEELMTLDSIYTIKTLEETDIDRETKIHIATVQSLVKRIMYNQSDKMPSVSDYDLIIIDEAHRGYILDKEMGEDELLYRNQDDYVSKYKTVIEYFDAVKIALTATPALHTTQIFGRPVFIYGYREAVVEGYLTDHDAPHNIKTKLSTEGIHYKKGDSIKIYDPLTSEIDDVSDIEDELDFEIENFNKDVITESFNRAVFEEITKYIDPDSDGKTLIYAVDDSHADLIVKVLKEIYEDYGVDNDAIMKITGSIFGGNKKKILEAIKRFKNEKYPNIVVTVDLLTTGIDVPEISTLVFMRRIKSRILFEQMLGRATRLCPKIGKTHFEIFDPVGVYESLEPVNTMRPVVVNPTATFTELLNGLESLDTDKQKENHINMIIAKLQRTKSKLSNSTLEEFKHLTGGKNPNDFIRDLREMDIKKSQEYLFNNQELFEMLIEGGLGEKRHVIVSLHEDAVISHTRGYGNVEKPEDYLEEFKNFVQNNMDKITALQIVCIRPKELTRDALKSLKLELDRNSFTELQLNSAWNEIKDENITADIITLIRQQAIGSSLINHEDRIKNAVKRLKFKHKFSTMQVGWLDRIEKHLLAESILDKETFESGAFKTKGGFKAVDKIFKNELDKIISEINEYLYEDWSA
jgi:type I restriction enzyme, R subunit